MKRKCLLALTIFMVLLFFSACRPAAEEIENPMEEVPSLAAIEDQLGFTFGSLPSDAENLAYFTIARTLAQADFILDSVAYTSRKALISEDDLSGVYLNFENGQTLMDERGNNVFYEYNNDGAGLARWQNDSFAYSLFCPQDFDLQRMKGLVNQIS